MRWAALLLATSLCCALPLEARVKVLYSGGDKATRNQARKSTDIFAVRHQAGLRPIQIQRLHALAQTQIPRGLEALGYYQATVTASLDLAADPPTARYRIEPGPPTTISAVDVQIDGAAASDPFIESLRTRLAPKVGERFVHAPYEASKRALLNALAAHGYLEAEIKSARVEVERLKGIARVQLAIASGPRFKVGALIVEGSQFAPGYIERYYALPDDGYYQQSDLLALQQRLSDTEYFAIVDVTPDLEQARDAVVPIRVALKPAKRRLYRGGIGFTTDVGAGVFGGVEARYLNQRGHRGSIETELMQRRRRLAVSYVLPSFDAGDRQRSIGLALRDENTATVDERSTEVVIADSRPLGSFALQSAVKLQSGDYTVGGERGSSTLLYPEVSLERLRQNDPLYPTRGHRIRVKLRQSIAGDAQFTQVEAGIKWLRALDDDGRRRVLARLDVGYTATDELSDLPPNLRFFAGGDQSVRGYEYRGLGPLNTRGLVRGGERLAVASVEFEQRISKSFGVAAFADVGNAFDNGADAVRGAGIGLRWRSPIGPVRLDLAQPLTEDFDDGLRVHLVIGPDL